MLGLVCFFMRLVSYLERGLSLLPNRSFARGTPFLLQDVKKCQYFFINDLVHLPGATRRLYAKRWQRTPKVAAYLKKRPKRTCSGSRAVDDRHSGDCTFLQATLSVRLNMRGPNNGQNQLRTDFRGQ